MAATQKDDAVTRELRAIKNLLILSLYASDVPSERIAKAIDMHPGTIRKMFGKTNPNKNSRGKGKEV